MLFNVTVSLAGCLAGVRHFSLRPVGLQDSLEVQLESLCSCDCRRQRRQPDAEQCAQGQGDFQCGVCVCQPGFMGSRCECNEENALLSSCLASNQSEVCSGEGQCYCGQCVCHASAFGRIYGKYCECDNYSCVRFRGELCGGVCLLLTLSCHHLFNVALLYLGDQQSVSLLIWWVCDPGMGRQGCFDWVRGQPAFMLGTVVSQ